MKRLVIVCGAVAALGFGVTGAVAASAPRARLRGFVCHRALDPGNREVSTTAVMRPLQGTERMQLKFELLRQTKFLGPWKQVKGGDLGRWLSPDDPTLGQQPGDVWILNHPVVGLYGPAHYRFRVGFRWIGPDQRVLGFIVRDTPTCYQPELRPDLLVKSITVEPISGKPSQDAYTALIRNRGATAAGTFVVEFTYGEVVKKRTVPGLASHGAIHLRFVGPVCTTDTAPTVIVDPYDQVDDFDRANNTLTATCPTSSPSSSSGGNPPSGS